MSLAEITPAGKGDVIVYAPYYQGAKKDRLPMAIGIQQQGYLEGTRPIEGGRDIPFVATWNVAKLPSDLTRCQIQFDGSAERNYELTLVNSEFIGYLIDVAIAYEKDGTIDFTQAFYRKLLGIEDDRGAGN